MKRTILILLLIACVTVGKSQTKLPELKTFDAKIILSKLIEFEPHSFTNYYVITYLFANESESAHIKGTDEVSHSILIVKTEYGEHEVSKFYMIKDVYNVKIVSIKENEIVININNSKTNKEYLF